MERRATEAKPLKGLEKLHLQSLEVQVNRKEIHHLIHRQIQAAGEGSNSACKRLGNPFYMSVFSCLSLERSWVFWGALSRSRHG